MAELGAHRRRQRFGQHGVAILVLQVPLERLEQAGRFADADDQVFGGDGAAVEKGRGVLAVEGDLGDPRALEYLHALLDRGRQEPQRQLVGIDKAPVGQLHPACRRQRRLALQQGRSEPGRAQAGLFSARQFSLQQLVGPAFGQKARGIPQVWPRLDAQALDRGRQLTRRFLGEFEQRPRCPLARARLEVAVRRAGFARQQAGGATAAALPHPAGLEKDDLHPRRRARLRRHGAGHAATNDDDRVADDAAECREIGPFLYGNGIKPGGDAIASLRHGQILT